MGLLDEDSYTCTSYLPQVGNIPKQGDILSWAESSAVIYANSVLGARCNRNSGILEVMGSVVCLPMRAARRIGSWKSDANTNRKLSFSVPPSV